MLAPMRIRTHPAARRPVLALLLCMGLGMLSSVAFSLVPEPLITVPLLALLAWSLLPFFLVTTVELGEDVAVTRMGSTRRYPWSRFCAFISDRNGVLLTPYLRKFPTEGLRGVFLALPRDERKRVERLLEEKGLARR